MKLFSYTVAMLSLVSSLGASAAETAVSELTVGLGDSKTFDVTVNAARGFSGGQVMLKVDRSALSALDRENEVDIQVSPSSIQLAAGASAQVKVTITTQSTVPSFNNGALDVVATTGVDTLAGKASLKLTVEPVLEIRVLGPDPANAGQMLWSTDPVGVTELRKHAKGVKVRFVNYDTEARHMVHGDGAIPHQKFDKTFPGQPDYMDPAPAKGQPGGVYEGVITVQQKTLGFYYCHGEESTIRRIVFNAK